MMLLLPVDTYPEYRHFLSCVPVDVFDADGVFPLLLLCDSLVSDLLEVRNNVSESLGICQINVTHWTI